MSEKTEQLPVILPSWAELYLNGRKEYPESVIPPDLWDDLTFDQKMAIKKVAPELNPWTSFKYHPFGPLEI